VNILEFSIKPDWQEVEKLRGEAEGFFQATGLPEELIDSLTMVTSELIENGIKYGSFSGKQETVRVIISLEPENITIEVIHPVDEKAYPNLTNLDRTIQWIRGYQDPFEAFIERLREISKRPFEDKTSGLGLTRIAYEGQAILDFFVNEHGMLNVSAVSPLEAAG
jgi:hypothetical protein